MEKQVLPEAWELKCVEETLWMRSGSVDPRKHPNESFELYSMPAHDAGMEPEVLPGCDIGSSKKVVEPGDCLLSRLNPRIPRVWTVGPSKGRRQISSTDFVALVDRKRPSGEPWFESAFLRYMLLSSGFRDQVAREVQGATGSRQRLRRDDINAAVLPVPPLNEQRRIVARIEELFARVEEARRLRAAADEDAERLVPAALDSAWREMSRVEGVTTPLGELISDTRNGLYKPKRFYGHGALFIRMYNIEDRHLTFEDTARVEADQTEIAKFRLSEGDILFNRVNSPELVGKSAVVSSLSETAVYEAMLIRVRVDKAKLNPEFAVAMLNAPACLGDLRSRAKKAIAQASLNQQDLRETALPVPPLTEQRRIVEYLDGVQAQVAELKRLQVESAVELERLSGAVLARAFRGEL